MTADSCGVMQLARLNELAVRCRRACFLALVAGLMTACMAAEPLRYGNYGGPAPLAAGAGPRVAGLIGAEFSTRWFPRSARFAPDNSNVVVSLCHFRYSYYCRIARYWPREDRWEVLPSERGTSEAWPDYAPDGRTIVYAQARCTNYDCNFADFKLAAMRLDGSGKQLRETRGIQMPTVSPDGKRILYWGLNGSLKSESGRTYLSWDLFESPMDPTDGVEKRLTDQNYSGIYTGPRYLPDGEALLYTALADKFPGRYTFVVARSDGIRRGSPPRADIPPWSASRVQYLHAFSATQGWLAGRAALTFQPTADSTSLKTVFDASPYEASVADVSPSGQWLVSLQGASKGTIERGGFAGYWNAAAPVISRPAIPVMAIVDLRSLDVRAVTNWPADVEQISAPLP